MNGVNEELVHELSELIQIDGNVINYTREMIEPVLTQYGLDWDALIAYQTAISDVCNTLVHSAQHKLNNTHSVPLNTQYVRGHIQLGLAPMEFILPIVVVGENKTIH